MHVHSQNVNGQWPFFLIWLCELTHRTIKTQLNKVDQITGVSNGNSCLSSTVTAGICVFGGVMLMVPVARGDTPITISLFSLKANAVQINPEVMTSVTPISPKCFSPSVKQSDPVSTVINVASIVLVPAGGFCSFVCTVRWWFALPFV